ncbi:MAG: HD domain-containing protein [Lachnospiraceae bacterium]|nr:HD domain-containing protein [Lachnospiraceae bacterium]
MQMSEAEKGLLEIGYSMATESSFFLLFDTILDACMRYTNADGGTLYMVDDETDRLVHLLDVNRTLDTEEHQSASQADMQIAENRDTNIFTYTYHKRKLLNIEDIYEVKGFEVRAIKEFDARNHYRTRSVLVSPINVTGKKILGVMMLYNSLDDEGNVIPFSKDCERTVVSLTSQMANTLTNMILIQEMDEQLGSFVQSLTTAIDAKTPYNANHTRHVERYCMQLVDYINAQHTKGLIDVYITDNDREQLSMAAMLHDIGKIITPREMLNKSTRLGQFYEATVNKLEKIRLMMKIDMLEGRMDKTEWTMEDLRVSNFLAELERLNISDTLSDTDIERIDDIGARSYHPQKGAPIPYLDEEEKKYLHIRKGTLTQEEREVVQQHVVYTDRILADIKFTDKYNKVRRIAASHHEYLDGSGYPQGLRGENLDLLTRILTVCDIFDSLTADDRPYKGPMDLTEALTILQKMAEEGKLDPQVVSYITKCMKAE